ncbi:MAG TPA: TIGR02453 family protein [Gemmatimonadales bacterium]|nr:TIGR02453 family protein [Gemmatimonadales bacterium]
MPWYVYLARCRDGTLYTGVATDPVARLATHNRGRGARYTRSRRPITLAWLEPAADRSAALRREYAIKQWPRRAKEALMSKSTASATRFEGFRPAALTFLRQLKRNNNKGWFESHRPVYEQELREPFRALIEEVDVRLARIAPEIVGDPRRSMFRIHRDIRFSKDKSPYKTNAGVWFFHRDAGRGVGGDAEEGGAGFYFHLEPGRYFLAGGLWLPARPSLHKIRERLAEDLKSFKRVVTNSGFRRSYRLDTEHLLTRLPRGFAPGHPAEEWLRFQSFTASKELTEKQVLSPSLPRTLAEQFKRLAPLVRWLNETVGYRAAASRL